MAGSDGGVNAFQLFDRAACPDAPVAEQTAADAHRDFGVAGLDDKRRQQIEHDVVVVAGVQRHPVLRAGSDDAANHIERAVAVERRHLDRDHVVDCREAAPELGRQRDAAHRRLQVEAHQRDLRGDCGAVIDQLIDRCALHRRQRQHAGVVAMRERHLRLLDGLLGAAAQAGDQHHRPLRPLARGAGRALEHRLVQADVADRELRRVHAHRQAASAGIEVVARQRALAPGIEPARGVECERMSRNDAAAPQQRQHVGGQLRPVAPHRENARCAAVLAAGSRGAPVLYFGRKSLDGEFTVAGPRRQQENPCSNVSHSVS